MKSRYKYGLLVGLALGLAGAASVKADVATSANTPAHANPVTVVAPSTTSTNKNAVAPASENQPSTAKAEAPAQSVAPVNDQSVAAQSTVSDQTASQPTNQVQPQVTEFAAVAPKASSYHSGWYKEPYSNNTWQYYGSNGKAYQDGWYIIKGQWYYFNGSTLAVDGYYTDSPYSDSENSDYQYWQGNTGGTYLFDYNGHYLMNVWHKDKYSTNTWRYFGSNGKEYQDGWYIINGQWYYFSGSTLAVDGYYTDSPYSDSENSDYQAWQGNTGGTYLFDHNGHYLMNVWHKDKYSTNTWRYFGSNGKEYQDGWYIINGQWYYFSGSTLAVDGVIWDGYNYYLFDHNGHYAVNQWHKNQNSRNTWYYIGSDGKAYADGWYMIGGQWYYFDGSGVMAADESLWIDGAEYHFDHFGHYWQS